MIDQAEPDAPDRSGVAALLAEARAGRGDRRRRAPLLRLLARTWRVEIVGADHLAAAIGAGPDRCIYAIWHGRILRMHVVLA